MFDLANFGSVLFDVDDTLVASSKLHENAFLETIIEFKIEANFSYSEFSGMTTKKVFEAMGFSNSKLEALVFRKQEIASDLLTCAEAMPGALEILKFFKSENKAIYTVSSGSKRNVQKSLVAAGLWDYIIDSVSSEDVRNGKPDPECYLLALSRFNIDPKRVFAIEDSIAGCNSAISAGIQVIGVSKSSTLPSTDQFPELTHLLFELRKQRK